MTKYIPLLFIIVFILVGSIIILRNLPQQGILNQTGQEPVIGQTENQSVIAQNLTVPWEISFLPNGDILVTERIGNVRIIKKEQRLVSRTIYQFMDVYISSESGLLGMVIHPDFSNNKYIYFYYTYRDDNREILNRVVRFKLDNETLTEKQIIFDNIPGAQIHDGGRIAFGPDRLLYIATGDANRQNLAQDRNSLAGKILRLNDDGSTPIDNPFNNPIYSFGHRNPEGLTWDNQGRLWATEHGSSANDEVNLIEKGKNYGWPEIRGSQSREGLENPVINSGSDTWAPAGLAFFEGVLYFGGLRGQALFKTQVVANNLQPVNSLFKGDLGRIRVVVLGPDNMLYIATSNKDGRGFPKDGDDRIVKIDPRSL